ncbi:hypothetical protein Plo01_32470 [Planobispora longispora]|uniref:Uncharacterized protein n=1 Tax=Planobispora longispora TaxID=28887 RepID=A0A8J3W5U0_9ACTN|nr:hypothetical protein Plo01_32470 [Planobispora longispora]
MERHGKKEREGDSRRRERHAGRDGAPIAGRARAPRRDARRCQLRRAAVARARRPRPHPAPGDVAEFDTRTPHGVANTSPGGPVEYLIVFGPQGERLRPRTPPTAGRGVSTDPNKIIN